MNGSVNHRRPLQLHFARRAGELALAALVVIVVLAGCAAAPVGADRVSTRASYDQVEANALNASRPSAATLSLLHRYELDQLAIRHPDKAVCKLHERALATGDRDLLFALAELSYEAGDRIRGSLKAWDPRDARDFYLGSAVYAYLFLFGEGKDAKPTAFDRRFRAACDLYNYGLGLALTERRGTNGVVKLLAGQRKLPVGEIELRVDASHFPWPLDIAQEFLLADQFRVRGVSVRNREAGVGAPLITVGKLDPGLRMHRTLPATVFFRLQGALAQVAAGKGSGSLELYPGYGKDTVSVDDRTIPLERDLTVAAAYTLNQSFVWKVERLQFFSPSAGLKSQLLLAEPYQPGRIPLVFVHGTFSSPVWWAEMANALRADPVLRQRYQVWQFLYSSSKPLVLSATELRDALTEQVQKLDPDSKDAALQQMVVIGHSQGGLLAKFTATDTGDKLWRVLSDKPPEELNLSEKEVAEMRQLAFFKPLPFVTRVVFISTPHRGSYMSKGLVRTLVRKLVSMPGRVMERSAAFLIGAKEGIKLPKIFQGRMLTSLDSMSPKNPVLLAMAEIPVAPTVKAHSIIPVKGDGDYKTGRDGVVEYQSAHVDYVESELVVRSGHSCQAKPATIEEVRRILHEHLGSSEPQKTSQTPQ
jgi:pimeloyl-ACP methyl ester carboxylesterase